MKMRRITATLLILAMLLVCLPLQAFAVEVAGGTCGENLTWSLTDDGILTISGNGAMEDYQGALAAPWGEYQEQTKKIVVEEGVTYLGDYAFAWHDYVTEMELPDSLTATGDYIFQSCDNLMNVDFPAGDVAFGYGAFSECISLKSITIPETLSRVSDWMFFNCNGLETVNIPGNLDYLGYNAFYGYGTLTVTFLGDMPKDCSWAAFNGQKGTAYYPGDNDTWAGESFQLIVTKSDMVWIPTGDIPETVLTTGQYGMNLTWEITNLGKLTLSGTGEMEQYVDTPWINYVDQIYSVVVESGITEIDNYVFNDLKKLMTVEIGDTVKSVGQYAFSGCTNLKSVTFLGSVEVIQQRAFMSCPSLSEIKFCGDAPKNIDDYAFTHVCAVCYYPVDNDTWGPEIMLPYDGSISWEPYGEVDETVVASGIFGESLTWKLNSKGGLIISGTGAMPDFYSSDAPWNLYRDQIKVVKIQDGITHVGAYAFYEYASVYRVSLGTTLVSIGEGAFCGTGITNLILPKTLQSIGEGAFAGCFAIPKVEIPESVTSIGLYAFSGCSSLTWIGVEYNNPAYKSDDGVLYTKDGYTLLQCPAGYYNNSFHVLSECVYILPEAFAGCNTLTYVSMSNVEILGFGAFIGCKNLESIGLGGGSLTEVSSYAFAMCESLKNVEFPGGTARISDCAFQGCTGLESVVFPSTLSYIEEKAFDGCTALNQITFQGSVPVIAADAFTGVTAKAVYPYDSESWVASAMLGYGGNLTWEEGQKPLVGVFLSGTCTSSIDWTLYDNGVLVISGYGAMPDYSDTLLPPWQNYIYKVTDVVIEEGITSIGLYNFMSAPVKRIRIPASVDFIADDAIADCSMLRKIDVSSKNQTYASDSGVLYNKSKTQLLWCPRGYAGELTLASSTQSIRAYAFWGCRNLTSVTIPGSVQSIGDYAFMDCLGTIQFVDGSHTGLMRVYFEGDCPAFGLEPFRNVLASVYYPGQNLTWTELVRQNYGGNLTWIPVCDSHVPTVQIIDPDCIHAGTKIYTCSICDEVLGDPEVLPPLGHDYGLGEDGNPDFWDTTCDVCGAERVVDKHRPTHSMYRMYNPNTGEHFYTGSKEERQMLETAGWKFEGVGFTFPASTGAPVYRLFQPSTGEHLYTMDEAEKETLLGQGWNFEGIAFNSGYETEVPQFRLHNPNTQVGAYHFTASVQERDTLISLGWEYQGIGFYTCLQ